MNNHDPSDTAGEPPPLCVRYNTEKQKANKKWGRSGYAYLPMMCVMLQYTMD